MMTTSEVCSVCRAVLCPEPGQSFTPDQQSTYFTPGGQNLHTFEEAVRRNCVICATIFDLINTSQALWSNISPESWSSLSYRVEKNSSDEGLTRVNVVFTDPFTNKTNDLRFRLIATDCMCH